MKRDYYVRKHCKHEGCKEVAVYSYDTRRELRAAEERNRKEWLCLRHSKPETVIGYDNKKTEVLIKCIELKHGKYWQAEEQFGTDKSISGFQHGNGYRIYAKDFEVGTIIKITAEIIIP